MAGIGFALRHVFQTDSPAQKVRGYSYALLIAAGPMLISIALLLALQSLMRLTGVSLRDRDLVSALLTYGFIFAMIISSGPAIALTRFISDRLYSNSQEGIRASISGALALICLLSLVTGGVLFGQLALAPAVRLLSCLLLTELAALYVLMSYVSAIKAYTAVAGSFAAGCCLTLILSCAGIFIARDAVLVVLTALVLGYGLSLLRLVAVISGSYATQGNDVIAFRQWLCRMPALVLSHLFYALALFSHNFVIWLTAAPALMPERSLYFVHSYDIACFMAVLTLLPGSVRFLVVVETAFFEKYATYTTALGRSGTMQQIISSRQQMIQCLWRQLRSLFQFQATISIMIALVGSRVILPLLGMDRQTLGVFPIACLGFMLIWLVFILVTFILYFDQQHQAMRIMLLLWLSTTLLTLLLVPVGSHFRGVGLLAGAAATIPYALASLRRTLKSIDYLIYGGSEAIFDA